MLLAALALTVTSCHDDSPVATIGTDGATSEEKDMYLNIRVPRTYAATAGTTTDKDDRVETLDILVFKKGDGTDADKDANKYYVYTACKGTPATDADGKPLDNTFKVVMPVGTDLILHVFVNYNEADLTANNFYNCKDTEMSDALKKFTVTAALNDASTDLLPMHGYISEVKIDKTAANSNISIPVLRSVASVQVMTKATKPSDADPYQPGELEDSDGNPYTLSTVHLYRYPNKGQMGANANAYPSVRRVPTKPAR
ncbi:MAG: fimbrial protein [Bacteroides sp.]|nr:fimbrial protein [Bacteroides sp.]